MDLGSITIGAIVLALCILPFILFQIRKRNKENQKLLELSNTAKEHKCIITKHEFWGNYLIGIDDVNNFVFFHRFTKDLVTKQFIDLSLVEKCYIIRTTRSSKGKDDLNQSIEKLELAFTPRQQADEIVRLEFYNESVSIQLYGELQSIEKWSQLINKKIVG